MEVIKKGHEGECDGGAAGVRCLLEDQQGAL